MNNYCRNCGEKLTNSNVCEKCGTKVLTNRVGELDKALAKKYIIIFFIMLILHFMRYDIISMFSLYNLEFIVSPIILCSPLILIIFVIFAKKKLKYSKFFNIVFWIMLLLIIMYILLIIFAILSCEYEF